MSDFAPAIAVVLQHEGGWVSNVHDLGGETNFGVSTLIILRENITPQDLGLDPATYGEPGWLKPMKVDAAKSIYRRLFWDRYGYGDILDQTAATKVFDCAVNCGPQRAHTMAQKAVVKLGRPLVVDGQLGPQTLAAINVTDPRAFVRGFADEMKDYYEGIIAARPANKEFEANWLKRARWGT